MCEIRMRERHSEDLATRSVEVSDRGDEPAGVVACMELDFGDARKILSDHVAV
jgi:hypothetical protein